MAFFPNSGGGFFGSEMSPLEQFLRAQGFVQQRGGVPPSPVTAAQMGYASPGPNFYAGQQIGGVGQFPFQSILGLFEGARGVTPDSTTGALSTGIVGPTFSGAQQGVGTVAQPGQTPNTGMPGAMPAFDQNLGLLGYGSFGGAFSGGTGSGAGLGGGSSSGAGPSPLGSVTGALNFGAAQQAQQQAQPVTLGDTGGTSLSDQVRSGQQAPSITPSPAFPSVDTLTQSGAPGYVPQPGVGPALFTPDQLRSLGIPTDPGLATSNVGAIGAPGPGQVDLSTFTDPGLFGGLSPGVTPSLGPTGSVTLGGALSGGLSGGLSFLNLLQQAQRGNPLGAAMGGLGALRGLNTLTGGALSTGAQNLIQQIPGISNLLSGVSDLTAPITQQVTQLLTPVMQPIADALGVSVDNLIPGVGTVANLGLGAANMAQGWGGMNNDQKTQQMLDTILGSVPVVGQILSGITDAIYSAQREGAHSWPVVGQAASALQTGAQMSQDQAAQILAATQGATDIPTLEQAVTALGGSLLPYYRTIASPLGGAITLGDFYRRTHQDPTALQHEEEANMFGLLNDVGKLQQLGVSNADIGNLLPASDIQTISTLNAGGVAPQLAALAPTGYGLNPTVVDPYGYGSYGGNLNSPWFQSQALGGPLWYELSKVGMYPQFAAHGVTDPGLNQAYLDSTKQWAATDPGTLLHWQNDPYIFASLSGPQA